MHILLDYKIVQAFQYLLSGIDQTKYLCQLVSQSEHKLAPHEHLEAHISRDIFCFFHNFVKNSFQVHLYVDGLQCIVPFIEHLSEFSHMVELLSAVSE